MIERIEFLHMPESKSQYDCHLNAVTYVLVNGSRTKKSHRIIHHQLGYWPVTGHTISNIAVGEFFKTLEEAKKQSLLDIISSL